MVLSLVDRWRCYRLKEEWVVEAPVDLATITERYTSAAEEFIHTHRRHPFFLYLPHAMPGSEPVPSVGGAFEEASGNGPYADCVAELDASTGRILDAVRDAGIEADTLVLFSSDNGAVRGHGGANLPCGGWGYSTGEGGMRVPLIARWPGRIPPARENMLLSTPDLMPSLLTLMGLGEQVPEGVEGTDYSAAMLGKVFTPPESALYLSISSAKPKLGRRGLITDRYTFVVER